MNNNSQKSIEIKSIPYRVDLAPELFSPIESKCGSMLLRSAATGHVDNRFDILVTEPVATLTTRGNSSYIEIDGQLQISDQDPFELINELQQRMLPSIQFDTELPFVGGVLGLFSYDLGRRVETLPELAEKDIDLDDMAVGLYSWAVVVDHQRQQAWVVGTEVEQHWQWLTEQSAPPPSPFKLTSDWHSNMTRAEYQTKFEKVQEYLLSGDCYQINLAQRFSASYQGSEWQAYRKLEASNSAPFSAFLRLKQGAILSVSPERFIQLNQQDIETKPIKGTRPRSADPVTDKRMAEQLASAEKDQAENLMIVDLLRNDIGRVAKPGSVHVPKLFDVESFPAVHHLVSTIRAKLDDRYNATDLLRASFPGGSITGAPKVRAMEIIEELEPNRRSAYCGSIGYISRHGRMDTSITIRTLVANQQTLYAWAGGGVVADSECQSEYQETLDKVSRILPTLKD
ncbi:aminodeoxychorismate synthase component 1 [Vibrio sp.]|uniref:aminodeoxychorismate synthase component 1 n=1 Tax=Vibrio sp. TaxID=678 RepID=UPI003D0D0898